MRKYILLFGLLTLVLSACRIESNIMIDINDDGSAKVTFEVGIDDELLELMAENGASEGDLIADLGSLPGGDGEVSTRKEGDMNYTVVTADVDDLSAWDATRLDDGGFATFNYTFDEKNASLSATIEGQDEDDLGGDFGFDPSVITGEFFSAEVIVRMPGTVTQHNADEVRDGALVWHLPLSGSLDIFAESKFGSSGSSMIWIVVAVVGTLGILAALAVVVVKRNESEKAVAEAVTAHEATEPSPSSSETAVDTDDDTDHDDESQPETTNTDTSP
jgi:hypothetical protein